MRLAYIAGPYRADTEWGIIENIRAAEKVAIELWQMGYAVICPHLNTAHFGGLCDDDVWLKGDLEILSRCDLLVVCQPYGKSQGTKAEVAFAHYHGIPVYRWWEKKPESVWGS